MLADLPSFGRNPRGSPDFLAYPVPKACMHGLGTGVPRCLGVARSASSPKAAQALGCSLTPGLRISFGRVTCMARTASVPGLWTMGFLLLRGACVWVWVVVGFGIRLHPATPGWGVGACVRLCVRSACTLPLLAGVCGVGLCGWVRVPAAPRHSWLGCRGLCLLVCALRLQAATPGWGVRRGCVCLGSAFGCAPPVLAGVLGCVCACVRAPLVPRFSWLGRAAWVCVLGLGFWLRPTPSGSGVGVRLCLSARSTCTPPLLAGVCGGDACVWARVSAAPRHSWLGCWLVCVLVWALRLRSQLLAGVRAVGVCVWARVSAAPRHSWLGCWAVCVLVWAFRLHPATPGWGARRGCVCLGSGFSCAPPLLAGVLGCVCAGVGAPLAPRHSWLRCAPWVCMFGLGFRLRPATPGWGVGVCVCSCACPPCTPPLLAGVCGLGVCVWARDLAAPRHSWLGCRGVCVLVCVLLLYHSWLGCAVGMCVFGLGFQLHPATPGWNVGLCVCSCGRSACDRNSWLGCAPWVCVFGLGFRLRPATPGWGVGLCVCWCGHSACTPPLPAGVRAVGVCVWARASAAPRHSWLGCSGVCVLVWALRLHPATPGCGARPGCVCLDSGSGCAPPLLAGVLGCVCARVRAPLVPRHSWLGCAVWVCVFGLGIWLRPATPGWGVGVCVCWCACSSCTPPLLAGVCCLGVCAWARVSAAPRHSWLGCWAVCVLVCALRLHPATSGWAVRCGSVCSGSGFGCAPPLLAGVLGCVCAYVRAPLAPRHSWLGCAPWVCVFGLGFRLRPPLLAGVLGCAFLCACSPCTPPLLAGVRGVGVCAWARVSAAPRHSWLECWGVRVCVRASLVPRHSWLGSAVGVCVFGLRFRLHPATPRWVVGLCVCWCGRSACTCHSWLGCAPWVCVFGLRFRLRPATPGMGVGLCVCWCGRSSCTPPLLAWVRAVGVCVWAPVSAAPRHSWHVLVWALRLHPATPGLTGRRGCVCLGSGLGCTPPSLACAGVGAPLAPRHSWLGKLLHDSRTLEPCPRTKKKYR